MGPLSRALKSAVPLFCQDALSGDANRYLAFDPGQRHALQEITLREKEDGNHW